MSMINISDCKTCNHSGICKHEAEAIKAKALERKIIDKEQRVYVEGFLICAFYSPTDTQRGI